MDKAKDFIERHSKPLFWGSIIVMGVVAVGFILHFVGINIWS